MFRSLKSIAVAAVAATGLTFAGAQDASAQGFSLSVGRGGFYLGPGYGYYGPGVRYPSYGYPAYGYRSYYGGPAYRGGYVTPGYRYGYRRWNNDWDRGDWRRFNRRLERRFDWDD